MKQVKMSESRLSGLKDEQDAREKQILQSSNQTNPDPATKKILQSSNQANPDSDNRKLGWEIKKLGEVCDVIGGGTPSKRNSKFYEGDILWATVRDMKSEIISDTEYKITEEAAKKSSTNIIPKGNVIIATRVGLGKVCIIEKDTAINQDLRGIVPKNPKKLDNRFLFQWFKSISHLIVEEGTGATVQGVKLPFIKDLQIPLPSLPEQQRIVAILDEAFAAIAKAKANAEQNLKNTMELFESFLQGVFEKGDWETKTIEMVCDEIFAGGDAPKNNFSLEPNEKHTIPIYANAVKDRGLYGYTDFARVTKPCVTIAARGSGTGHTELRNEHFLPIVRLIVCIPDTKQISTEFLKYTIDNLVIQRSGSAIPQLTVPMIKDYKIPVPSIEEQKQIIEKAETLKQQKESLENVYFKKIEGLEELKKSILQKAFAGELKTEKAVAV